MMQKTQSPLGKSIWLAAACLAFIGPGALAQTKSRTMPDTGQFIALSDNAKGMLIIDDTAKPGSDGRAMVDTWVVLKAPAATPSYRFDNMAMLYAVRCDGRQQRMVRTAAFMGDKFVASDLPFSSFEPTGKGTIADVIVTRVCSNVPATVVTDSRATARSWAK